MDFVANHVSSRHPAFVRARDDPSCPERAWFSFGDDGRYRSFFGVDAMPRLDTDASEVARYLTESAVHRLERGVDGFRLDYANGPSHAFWSAFRAATRAAHPTSALLGEIVETAALQRSYRGRLDGSLDFLLMQQMRAFFAADTVGARSFASFLDRHLTFFADDFVLPSFLDNHDLNRFLWLSRGDTDRLKLAALCQFTLPHPPMVYYGTEVGLNQNRDVQHPDGSRRLEESRLPMIWGEAQDRGRHGFYLVLIAIRRRLPALWRGRRSVLLATAGDVHAVASLAGATHAVVAINRGPSERTVDLPTGTTVALATTAGVRRTGTSVMLPPRSGALLLA